MKSEINDENLYNKVISEVQSGDLIKAKASIDRLRSSNSNSFDVSCLAAGIEASLGDYQTAIDHYTIALTKTNRREALLDVQFNLARCYEITSQFSKAVCCYNSMIENGSSLPESWFGLAQNEIVLGNAREAERAYQQVIGLTNISQHGLIRSHAFYALSMSKTNFAELVPTITQELKKARIAKVIANLHFALANIYESEGKYEKAFDSFSEANNSLLKSIPPHNHRRTLAHAEKVIKTFGAEFKKGAIGLNKTKDNDGARPIFIVGLPRSGSTLIESILSCTPNSLALGEVEYMSSVINKVRSMGFNADYPELVNELSKDTIEELASHYLNLTEANAKIRIIDKFLANFWNVGLIKTLFPTAKIIACERNPMDACFSLYRQNFHEGHAYSNSLQSCADYYSTYQMLISHWTERYVNQIHRVTYESFVANTESECRRLFDFCELDWSSEYLNSFVNRRTVKTASASQVREPINSHGLNRWKKYEVQLKMLTNRFII